MSGHLSIFIQILVLYHILNTSLTNFVSCPELRTSAVCAACRRKMLTPCR